MSLDNFKAQAASLVLIALIIATFAVALDAFQDNLEDDNPCAVTTAYWNSTASACHAGANNGTIISGTNYQYNVTQEGLQGTGNASSYLSTIGTLIGVAALIAIVMGAFMYVKS